MEKKLQATLGKRLSPEEAGNDESSLPVNAELRNQESSKEFNLYGSFWVYLNDRQRIIFSLLWSLPHDIRRIAVRQLFPKQYWRVLGKRRELENSFIHPEKGYTYGIKEFHAKKCIFVHIPKCAGIAIAHSLFGSAVPHSTITDYQIMFGSEIFNRYFKFTIVRNPWSRLVSAFNFIKAGGFDSYDAMWSRKHMAQFHSFDEFVKYLDVHRDYLRWPHFFPQYRWLVTPTGKVPLDYIGRLENINEAIETISSELKLGEVGLKKMNSSVSPEKKHYSEYYTENTKKIVHELYKKDIRLLGYQFES
ncbi:sulfotransferase family 2 domain-containing protein [Methylocaldum sp. MU1018]